MGKVKEAAGEAAEEAVWEWKPRDDEEEVGGDLNIWNPALDGNEGDELEGEVVAIEEGIYGIEAKIKTDIGDVLTTAAHRVLQTALVKLNVGDNVRITYTGAYTTKKGMTAKNYKVARRK